MDCIHNRKEVYRTSSFDDTEVINFYKLLMVPRAGLEPARSFLRGILSPLCLPIPPPGH